MIKTKSQTEQDIEKLENLAESDRLAFAAASVVHTTVYDYLWGLPPERIIDIFNSLGVSQTIAMCSLHKVGSDALNALNVLTNGGVPTTADAARYPILGPFDPAPEETSYIRISEIGVFEWFGYTAPAPEEEIIEE